MSASTPRIAVFGAGRWGMNHVRNFHALGALAAVVDPDPAAADRVRELDQDVAFHTAQEPVLADPDIDGIVLATPAPRHREDALTVIEAGKDVFVEKPMALHVADAEEMASAAEAAGRILMVGHLLLYQPAIDWIRRQIEAGRLGELRHIETRRLNLGTVRAHENVLWSFSPHDLAIIHVLLGEPALEEARAFGQASVQPDVEDQVHADFRFGGGVTAHVHASWFWPVKLRATTIVGTEAAIVYDEVAQRVTLHEARIDPESLATDRGSVEEAPVTDAQPLRIECQHFLDRIADRGRPLSHGRHGVEVIRMLEEATREMARG